jgi:hypothetical protein
MKTKRPLIRTTQLGFGAIVAVLLIVGIIVPHFVVKTVCTDHLNATS